MNKPHLDKVDFLRGIAILLVVTFHSQLVLFPGYEALEYNESNWLKLDGTSNIILNFSPTAFGWSGVELFLIISGFLIHFGYLTSKSEFNIRSFYSKRFWRIYPPYILVMLFIFFFSGAFAYYLLTAPGLKDTVLHLFFLHNLTDTTFYSINSSFWSLALEVQLYLVYPLLLMARKKIGMKKVFFATILLSFILSIIGMLIPKMGNTYAYQTSVLKYWFIWAGGAYLAEKYLTKEKLFNRNGLIISIVLLLLGMASKLHLYSAQLTVFLLTAGLIGIFEYVINNEKLNVKGLLFRGISVVGICSYSIYLIHRPYLDGLFNSFKLLENDKWKYYVMPFRVIPVFIVLFLISYSVYLFIEKPSIELGQKLRNKAKGNVNNN